MPDAQLLHRTAGHLPAAELTLDVSLRPADPPDRELLLRTYAATRTEELALLPWDDAGREAFVRMQFETQERAYRLQAPHATVDVILRDGEPVGRLIADRAAGELRVLDIALLPEHRGAGIGTVLLERIAAEADAAGVPVTMHVALDNRARALYERLGFREVSRDAVYARIERQAKTAS